MAPKIILYTNHACPWAHRAHIALAELGLSFEEVIIDLTVPRTAEYLAVNPRGLVPSLSYDGQIITESGVVAQFLTDAYPSHLVPPSGTVDGALRRARIAFFVDAYFSKFQSHLTKATFAKTDADAQAAIETAFDGLVKEVEPLLADAKPYFGGSDKLTLAEVLAASFAIRTISWSNAGIFPSDVTAQLAERAPNFKRWAENLAKHPSVNNIYDEKKIVEGAKARIAKIRAS